MNAIADTALFTDSRGRSRAPRTDSERRMTAPDALSAIATWLASLYGIATLTAAGLVIGVLLARRGR